MDSLWDEDHDYTVARDAEWTRISSEFTNVGYREGITSGKEAALQEGFDSGFADIGAPLGRELGILRGRSSAILSYLISQASTASSNLDAMLQEAREITAQLGNVRFSDIEPRDLEAEQHAREHLDMEPEEIMGEDGGERRRMEGVEDVLARLSAGEGAANGQAQGRPTLEDVQRLKVKLEVLGAQLGLEMDGS